MSSNFSKDGMIAKICFGNLYIFYSPSSSYISNIAAGFVVGTLFSVAGIIFNSLVLYIFWKSPRMRSKMTYFTIMVLSSNDLLVVTIVQPLAALELLVQILSTPKCVYIVFIYHAGFFFCGMSLFTLFVINIERYFSVVRPFLHRTMVTKRRFLLTCGFGWLLVLLTVASQALSPVVGLFVISIFLLIVCVTSFFVYVSIFLFARKTLRNLNTQVSNVNTQDGNVNTQDGNVNTQDNFSNFLRELKMAKTYVLIVSLSFICYLPYVVSVIYYDIGGSVAKEKVKWMKGIPLWITMFLYMNSTLNCLVFFWMNRELRKEGSKIIKEYFSSRDER